MTTTSVPAARRQNPEWASELDAALPEQLLSNALSRFGDRVALATSLSAEDQVVTDLLCRLTPHPRVFTLDTGRLPQETYDAIAATEERYGIRIKLLFPDRQEVEAFLAEHGPNAFYRGEDLRKRCCHLRKVLPLRREQATLDAWITGLRREQSVTRAQVAKVEWDADSRLVKINPLADWTLHQVWDYIRAHDIPYNALHDRGYPSIGCAPCTRAVRCTEDIRAGRWWWERPEHKECGLHREQGI